MRGSRWVLPWWWVLVLLVTVAVLVAGCGSGSAVHPRARTATSAAPALLAPPCDSSVIASGHGYMGECAPRPALPTRPPAAALNGQIGGDTSNNDPILGSIWAQVHHPFHYLKLIQGTAFIDQYAAAQIRDARRYHPGVYLGGYDFFEVCQNDPRAEARLFVSRERALGLLGPATMPPAGDAEWPLKACGGSVARARAWIGSWVRVVEHLTHRLVLLYTGAWWFDPNVGCWWPSATYAWISGYGVRYPFMPCGRHELDFWQFSSTYLIVSGHYGDISVYRGGPALSAIAHVRSAPRKPKRNPKLLATLEHKRTILRIRLARHHCHKSGPHRHVTLLCRVTWHRGDLLTHWILVLSGR